MVHEAVVTDEANDAVPPLKPVRCPTKELDIWVGEFADARRLGVLGVSVFQAAVDDGVAAVLVIVVLVELADVVGRVADNNGNGRFFRDYSKVTGRIE